MYQKLQEKTALPDTDVFVDLAEYDYFCDLVHARTGNGRVFVLGEEPLLDAFVLSNQTHGLTLYGQPGHEYQIEQAGEFGAGASWSAVRTLHLTSSADSAGPMESSAGTIFYRTRDLTLDPRLMSAKVEAGKIVIEWPEAAGNCIVQEKAFLTQSWMASPLVPQLHAGRYRVVIPVPRGSTFYRLRCAP